MAAIIDRRKHDIDVIERVLGGAREAGEEGDPQTDVVDIGVRPWLVGAATGAVQVAVSGLRKEEEPVHAPAEPSEAHGADEYESDRRGEHTYPADGRTEPRSHRERDALKSRLEHRD